MASKYVRYKATDKGKGPMMRKGGATAESAVGRGMFKAGPSKKKKKKSKAAMKYA